MFQSFQYKTSITHSGFNDYSKRCVRCVEMIFRITSKRAYISQWKNSEDKKISLMLSMKDFFFFRFLHLIALHDFLPSIFLNKADIIKKKRLLIIYKRESQHNLMLLNIV